MNTLNAQLDTYTTAIEQALDRHVLPQTGADSRLYEAVRYALLDGGKRIRPVLTLATAQLFGASLDDALTPACAIEMIHTYSMIHDDLPCMDDDDFRRGKPSLHRQYGEALAVLAGDFLLTKAFEILSENSKLQSEIKLNMINLFAKASGGRGMIGGQVIDILSEGQTIEFHLLSELHAKKTGALISAAIECGSLVASAPVDQRQLLIEFAEKIGLAFQIIDDILDVTAGTKKRGNKSSSDQINNKSTYVSLLGINEAQSRAAKLYNEAIASLEQLPQDTGFLKELAHFIINRDH